VNDAGERPAAHVAVLIVDDEPKMRTAVAKNLHLHGFTCRTAETAEEGLALLAEDEVQVLISDINMPGRDGVWLLRQVSEKHPDLAVIMLTGLAQLDLAVQCLQDGASDFLAKPVRTTHLLTAIERALDKRRLILENREYRQELEARIEAATAELRRAHDDLAGAYRMTLEALSSALDAREAETGSHSRRVARYTLALADRIGVQRERRDDLARGALLHDIGKIGVADSILLKPGPLTEEEWAIMRRHPEIGHHILAGIPFLKPAAEIVLSHHERFDGTGYPQGLRGEKIPLGARIFTVADALDAMTSDRPYRPARSVTSAFAEISSCAGEQFDPAVVEGLTALGVDGILELKRQSND